MQDQTTYKKIASHEAKKGEFDKCLLLYSGGLDTSILLKWIQDHYKCDLYALTIDIGQKEDFVAIKEKALKLGAKKAFVIDAKEEFANEYISDAIKANAGYQGDYHLFCPLGRAIISKISVDIAQKEGIKVIAHGCTGKGNDQVRFEGYMTTLDPTLKVIAPVREWSMGRDEQLVYAQKHGIPIHQTGEKIYSYDENLWGDSAEGGEIEDIGKIPDFEKCLITCQTPEKAPDKAQTLEIEFENGIPTAIDQAPMSLLDIIEYLTKIGAHHGVGITPLIEDRIVGMKIRGVYEEPAAEIIIQAHKNLEKLVCTGEEIEFKTMIDQKWAYLTYGAKWYHPLMDHLNSYINSVNTKVTGKVKIALYKGKAMVVSATSPHSLFNEDLATFMKNDTFNQNASAGFIEHYNLAQKTAYNLKPCQNSGQKKDQRQIQSLKPIPSEKTTFSTIN